MAEVLPPYRTNSFPGDGVEPRTPQMNKRIEGSLRVASPPPEGGQHQP
jgi:hypothetical protein